MSTIKFIVIAGIILVSFTAYGEAIHCWACSSEMDHHCADPFNASHYSLMDCDRDRSQSPYLQSQAVCRKIKKKVNNEIITERSCNWEISRANENNPCSHASWPTYVKLEHCSTCSTDACNGSEKRNIPLILFLMPLLTILHKTSFHN